MHTADTGTYNPGGQDQLLQSHRAQWEKPLFSRRRGAPSRSWIGSVTYRSSWWPRWALVTPWSRSSLETEAKHALTTAPLPMTHDHLLTQSLPSEFPKGTQRYRRGICIPDGKSNRPMSGRLCLSSTSSCDPTAAAFYPCSHPKPHVGRTRIPFTCSPFRPSLCTCETNRGSAKVVVDIIPVSSTGGVHTERCNAAIPDFPRISPHL